MANFTRRKFIQVAGGAAAVSSLGFPAIVGAASKKVVAKCMDWDSQSMFPEQQKIVLPVLTSQDAIEGATAFAEKRAPNWKGK